MSTINYTFNKDKFSFSFYYNSLKRASEYDIGGVDNLEEGTSIGNPSWFILNLRYKKTIAPNVSFIVGVQNILDAHYKTFGSGISSSGRNFIISLQTNF